MMGELLSDLASVGYEVDSVSELRTSGLRYREAVPILLNWLPRSTSVAEKEEIVRALSVPWAREEALDPLIEEFRAVPLSGGPQEELLRWAIGNAIEVLWDDARLDELIELARDGRFGKARQMVVLGLGRSKKPEASDVLIALLDDPVVSGHAVKALGKLRVPRARPGLERMTSDSRAWVRKEAEKALARLPV
jgi:HEAT repeat protein